jgi:hypothetical protein
MLNHSQTSIKIEDQIKLILNIFKNNTPKAWLSVFLFVYLRVRMVRAIKK